MNRNRGQGLGVRGQEKEVKILQPSAFSLQPNFPPPMDLSGRDILKTIKDYLQKGEEALKVSHRSGASGYEVVRGYTALIDEFIKALFQKMEHECSSEFGVRSSELKNKTAVV